MNETCGDIIASMKKSHGRDITMFDQTFLRKSIEKRWNILGLSNAAEYFYNLEKNSSEAEALYRSLHVSFSHFFRDPVTYAILEERILPDIIAHKREGGEIRVWSAGCADGQEAYSLAILLSDLVEAREKDTRFRIFATDISQEALSAGKTGIYDEGAVQDVRKKHLHKYFVRQGSKYGIVPALRQSVSFHPYDLLDLTTAGLPESIYGDFDIVMCCNVLIYYKTEARQVIIRKLLQAVSPGGYLVTGESEKSMIQDVTKLQMISTPAAAFKSNINIGV